VNAQEFIHLPDVCQQSEVVEYIISGLRIVEEDPRTGDQNTVDKERKLKV